MAPVALLSKGPSPAARLHQRAPACYNWLCLCSTRRVRPCAFGSPWHTGSLTARQAAVGAPWRTCPSRSRAQARRSALARASSRRSGGPRHVHPLDAGLFEAAADGRLERLVQRFLARLAGRDPEDWGQSVATALLCCVLRAPRPAAAGSLAAVAAFRLASLALAVVLQVPRSPAALHARAGRGAAVLSKAVHLALPSSLGACSQSAAELGLGCAVRHSVAQTVRRLGRCVRAATGRLRGWRSGRACRAGRGRAAA